MRLDFFTPMAYSVPITLLSSFIWWMINTDITYANSITRIAPATRPITNGSLDFFFPCCCAVLGAATVFAGWGLTAVVWPSTVCSTGSATGISVSPDTSDAGALFSKEASDTGMVFSGDAAPSPTLVCGISSAAGSSVLPTGSTEGSAVFPVSSGTGSSVLPTLSGSDTVLSLVLPTVADTSPDLTLLPHFLQNWASSAISAPQFLQIIVFSSSYLFQLFS